MLGAKGMFSITNQTPPLTANLASAAGGLALVSGILTLLATNRIEMEISRLKDHHVVQQAREGVSHGNDSTFALAALTFAAFAYLDNAVRHNLHQQRIDGLERRSNMISACNFSGTLMLVLGLFVASNPVVSVLAFGLLGIASLCSVLTIAELSRSQRSMSAAGAGR